MSANKFIPPLGIEKSFLLSLGNHLETFHEFIGLHTITVFNLRKGRLAKICRFSNLPGRDFHDNLEIDKN